MLGAPPGSSFEVFGVDMLVDTDYRPWLVEVNAVPSLARKVSDVDDLAILYQCHAILLGEVTCFVFGLDMHLDTDYWSWLVQVKAVPSLACKVCYVENACTRLCTIAEKLPLLLGQQLSF